MENLHNNTQSCPLTRRELDVLELLVKGVKTADAATILNISRRTVEFHKLNTFAKLGVHRVTHANAIALKNGWVKL